MGVLSRDHMRPIASLPIREQDTEPRGAKIGIQKRSPITASLTCVSLRRRVGPCPGGRYRPSLCDLLHFRPPMPARPCAYMARDDLHPPRRPCFYTLVPRHRVARHAAAIHTAVHAKDPTHSPAHANYSRIAGACC